MRSYLFSLRFPYAVYEGAKRRQKEMGFRTLAQYLVNLVRCDLMIQRDHDWSRWFADLSEADQDFVDDHLVKTKKSVPGSQDTLSHYFCDGIIKVMMVLHHCTATQAIALLPDSVREFCARHGFH